MAMEVVRDNSIKVRNATNRIKLEYQLAVKVDDEKTGRETATYIYLQKSGHSEWRAH